MQRQIKKFSFFLLAVLFALLLLPVKHTSAATSKLLYVRFPGSLTDIYSINSDGSNDINLTNGGNDEIAGMHGVQWSPDGTKIAYVLSDSGATQFNVRVMNADGTNDTALTTDNVSGLYGGMQWSPDGTKLVFTSDSGGSAFNLYTINVNGTGRTQLTSSGLDVCPHWTTTNKIAFVSFRDGNMEIYTANPDGTSQTNITNSPDSDGYISNDGRCSFDVSNDGNKVVFSSDRTDPSNTYELYSANINGSGTTALTSSAANSRSFSPTWSNDGTMIAYGSDAHDPLGGNNSYQIYTMTAAGTNETQLTSSGGNVVATGTLFTGIEWSPDNSQIAFASNRNGSAQLFLMNANGSSQTMLVSSISFIPRWQPAASASTPGSSTPSSTTSGTLASTGDNRQFLIWAAMSFVIVGIASLFIAKRKSFTALGKLR